MTIPQDIIEKINPKYKEPIWEHKLVYDSSAEQLEPVYFWILDFMSDLGFDTEKIVDNFVTSPGSGYFAELGARATRMQEEGMKILGSVNVVLKSIINLLYDLKEFEIRLKQYDLAKSKNPKEREAGILGLKQVWMDKVDLQRGRGSINAMSYELGFSTLRDAFMAAKNVESVDKMDLNDIVKRVLKPRLAEFFSWKESSEAELRKRFEIEKNYLRSQVASLKLYSKWAKPYLRAAEELMMKKKGREPALVKAFNTIILELCVLGKNKINIAKEVDAKNLPKTFRNLKFKRNYYSCVFIDFTFRGIPTRTPQGHYVFGGRVEVDFKAFALNEDELKVLNKELEKEDFEDALKIIETVTDESLTQISKDIEHFLGKNEEGKTGKTAGKKEKNEKKKKEPEIGKIRKDSFEESIVRSLTEAYAAGLCFKIYTTYKKVHGMASMEEPEWNLPGRWNVPK